MVTPEVNLGPDEAGDPVGQNGEMGTDKNRGIEKLGCDKLEAGEKWGH